MQLTDEQRQKLIDTFDIVDTGSNVSLTIKLSATPITHNVALAIIRSALGNRVSISLRDGIYILS